MHNKGYVIDLGKFKIRQGDFLLIAGPCVIEDEKLTFRIAKYLKSLTEEFGIHFIFKASFDKANRTSLSSFRGPGLRKGLNILKKIKEKLNIVILSDVHCRLQVKEAAKILDVLQVPAFLCRQTDLLLEIAKNSKAINIKKGQFLAPWDVEHIIKKIESTGNRNIFITERGTFFGYNNLVVDFRSLAIMRSFGYPVIFDATHSVQSPAGKGICSGGERRFVPALSRAAIGFGCDGLFLEVHPHPPKALCDKDTMIDFSVVRVILEEVLKIKESLKGCL